MSKSSKTSLKSALKSSSRLAPAGEFLPAPDLELAALEPRILLDAAGLVTLADGGADLAIQAQASAAAEALFTPSEDTAPAAGNPVPVRSGDNGDRYEQAGRAFFAGSAHDGMAELTVEDALEFGLPGQAGEEIIFVDTSVSGYTSLLETISTDAEIILIDSGTDGISQITAHLEGRTGISAIHLISHGAEGEISLGTSTLDAETMQSQYAAQLAAIGAALTPDADILVYGCNFAAGEAGAEAASLLATLTGADVAGSTDNTGTVALEGDWDLEFATGDISRPLILDLSEWDGVLAPLDLTFSLFSTVTTLTNGAGEITGAIYENIGTIGTLPVDMVATVVNDSLAGAGGSVAQFSFFGDDFTILTNAAAGGTFDIVYTFFQSGTNQTVSVQGDPALAISDIDGNGAGNPVETVAASLSGLVSFTVNNPTTLETSTEGNLAIASGTANSIGLPPSAIRFDFGAASEVRLSYETTAGGRIFQHDGDGDFLFLSPQTTLIPLVDISAGLDLFTNTFTENEGGVAIVDADIAITNVVSLSGATVTLTNPSDGDQLLVNGSVASAGSVGGLAYTIDASGEDIVLTLSGTGTAEDYQAALLAITFNNGTENPDETDRLFSITVNSDGISSALNTSVVTVIGVNDLPLPDLEKVFVDEDTTLTVSAESGLLDGDTDPDGDPLLVTQFTIDGETTVYLAGETVTLAEGDLTIDADGSFSFIPAPDFAGDVPVISYLVSDGVGGTATASLTICINPVNDAPVTDDEKIFIDEDVSLDIEATAGLLQGDMDADGDSLLVAEFSVAGDAQVYLAGETVSLLEGDLTINADGSYRFVPAPHYTGLVPLATYVAIDGNGGVDTGTLTIYINPVNDAPVAEDDMASLDEDTTLSVDAASGLLQNDTDPDGDALMVTEFTIEGQPDAFAAGSTASMAGIGQLTIEADGAYSFVPEANYSGPVPAITYTVSDGSLTDTATLTIAITPFNDAPQTDGMLVPPPFNEGVSLVPLDASAVFSDPDGEALSFTATGLPAGVSIDPVTGVIDGTPAPGTADGGPASDGRFQVTVTATDPSGETAMTSFVLEIIRDAPVAAADLFMVSEDSSFTGNLLADNGNGADTDPEGGPVTVTRVLGSGNPADVFEVLDGTGLETVITGSNGGQFTVSSNGTVLFDPAGDFDSLAAGETVTTSIVYQIADEDGNVAATIATFVVSGANDAPGLTALADQVGMPSADDGAVITPLETAPFFSDPEGDSLTYTADNLPSGLSIDPVTGIISGAVASDASQGGNNPVQAPGVYDVTVTATDTAGAAVSAGFTYVISNPAPEAADIALETDEDTVLSVSGSNGLLPDILDLDGDLLSVAAVAGDAANIGLPVAGDNGGLFTIGADGAISFDPAGDFDDLAEGDLAVTRVFYTISDGQGGLDVAEIVVTITGVNDGITPVVDGEPVDPGTLPDPDNFIPVQLGADGAVLGIITLADFFADPDTGDVLAFSIDEASLPPGLVFDPVAGTISGVFASDASQGGDPLNPGSYSVGITASDLAGSSLTTNLTFLVSNPVPVAGDDGPLPVIQDIPAFLNILQNDADPDGDSLALIQINGTDVAAGDEVTLPSGAVIRVSASGTVTYLPQPGVTGTDSFSYTISDGQGGFDTADVFLNLITANEPPLALGSLPDQTSFDGQTIAAVDLSGNFTDLDQEPLSFAAEGLPPGLVMDGATGVISGTLSSDASVGGPYIVSVTVTDPVGATVSAPFLWVVDNLSPLSTAMLDNLSHNDGETITPVDLIGGFIDPQPDGDLLSFSVEGLPPGLTFDPATGLVSGTISSGASADEPYIVTVTATDGQGGVAAESFVWLVNNLNPALVEQLPNQAHMDGDTIAPFDISGAFNDPDGDPLTFAADGLPPGLVMDADTGVISGTLPSDASAEGPFTVVITAMDPEGGMSVDSFIWDVQNIIPDLVDPVADFAMNETGSIEIEAGGNFIEIDGDDLTYAATGLPEGLSLDPATGVITGTLGNAASLNGPFTIAVTVTDAQGGSATDVFGLMVINPAPVAGVLPDATILEGQPIMITAPFTDPDGDTLVYSATGLPAGLAIDPLTGVITGTPVPGVALFTSYDVTLTADDGQGGITSAGFTLTLDSDLVSPLLTDSARLSGADAFLASLSGEDGPLLADIADFLDREFATPTRDGFNPDLLNDGDTPDFRGQALRFTAPGYEGDLVIEGIAGDNAVYLQLSETLSELDDVTVLKWHVVDAAQRDQPLPDWISFDGRNNLVVLDRAVTGENHILQINAILDDGRVLAGDYRVNLTTGEVSVAGEIINRAMLFSEQLDIAAQRDAMPDPAFIAAITE